MFRFAALVLSLFAGVVPAQAQSSGPVVVELFTSQGCSSCPPADAFLGELSERSDVLPLALHVDYWDRLGWPDTFAQKAFTERQYAYGKAFGNRSIWTPQFVVQGGYYSRSDFRAMVEEHVAKLRAAPPVATVSLAEKGNALRIAAAPVDGDAPMAKVILVHFRPTADVAVKRGENAGRSLTYHNIVTNWRVVAQWNGQGEAELTVPMEHDRPVAVLLQAEGNGPILAADVLR